MGLFLGPQDHRVTISLRRPKAQGPGSRFTLVPKSQDQQGLVSCPPVHRTPSYIKAHSEQGSHRARKTNLGSPKAEEGSTLSQKEILSMLAFSSRSQHENETRVKMIKVPFPGHLFCARHCPEGPYQDEPYKWATILSPSLR